MNVSGGSNDSWCAYEVEKVAVESSPSYVPLKYDDRLPGVMGKLGSTAIIILMFTCEFFFKMFHDMLYT